MRDITLIFSTFKKIVKWKRSSLRQSFLKISVTGNLYHLMIGSTKLFINSDSQKEILLNWDQLRWFKKIPTRKSRSYTSRTDKTKKFWSPLTLIAITLLSLQKSAMLLHIAWLKKIFDKRCTILFSAISEMKGAKKSELDSEHVLDISKIFLADNLQCCVTFAW